MTYTTLSSFKASWLNLKGCLLAKSSVKKSQVKDKQSERAARLSEALRSNLRLRKKQARDRGASYEKVFDVPGRKSNAT